MADDNILFCRSSDDTTHADLWDDEVLIKAYDKAVNEAKAEVCKRMDIDSSQLNASSSGTKSKQKSKPQSQKNQKKWCVGSPCRAVYSEDGELYEAIVTKIFDDSKSCIVRFIGYNNIEKVELTSLLESEGLQGQIAQQKEAATGEQKSTRNEYHKTNGYHENNENPMDCEQNETKSFKDVYIPGSTFNPNLGAIPPAPPLPPQLMAKLPENDADALSSMLMSWYISGFHTGYYHGMKQAQNNQGHRKNNRY